MPFFTVIAGPNGAGKSTFSARLSVPRTVIFDPDIQKYKIEKQYPDISPDALETALTSDYEHAQARALGQSQHFTVETNLRNTFLLESLSYFRAAGYETRLIYMLLPDIATSLDRVALRVKQKGHFVDAESVRVNFEQGLLNLHKMIGHFDRVMLVSGINNNPSIEMQPHLLLNIHKGIITHENNEIPEWCNDMVKSIKIEIKQMPKGPGR